jgi:hypothetical protein
MPVIDSETKRTDAMDVRFLFIVPPVLAVIMMLVA